MDIVGIINREDKYGEYPIHLTHNDETLFTLVDYFVQKHDLVLNNDKSNRLKQQIDQVNDEKLKLDIDLTNLNAELEFLNGKLKKYMEKQQQQQQNDNNEKNKKRETKIYKMENLVQNKENEIINEISPVFHVDKITKPLFVIQGANDPRVKKSESDQIVAALEERGIEVPYMVKEDEGHGFYNEENQFDFYQEMEKFLNKHIGESL